MGRYCIRAKKGEKKSKDVKCACQEDGKVVTFKMKKNCGPPSTEVSAPSTMVPAPPKALASNGNSQKTRVINPNPEAPLACDENLHAKLESLIRNDGYRSAAWILEASKLYIKGIDF